MEDFFTKDYFKIEEHKIIEDQTLKKGVNHYTFSEYRELNYRMERPLNYGFPNYEEEIKLANEMYDKGETFTNLVSYFQRPKSTLKKYLGIKNIHENYQKGRKIFIEDGDEIISKDRGSPENNLININLNIDVSKLTDRELFVLKARWGIGMKKALTLGETGNLVGISRERVRQIMLKILRKLEFHKST